MPTCYAEVFLNILALVFTESFLLTVRERGAKTVQADSLYPATARVRKFHSPEQKFAFSDISPSQVPPLLMDHLSLAALWQNQETEKCIACFMGTIYLPDRPLKVSENPRLQNWP